MILIIIPTPNGRIDKSVCLNRKSALYKINEPTAIITSPAIIRE